MPACDRSPVADNTPLWLKHGRAGSSSGTTRAARPPSTTRGSDASPSPARTGAPLRPRRAVRQQAAHPTAAGARYPDQHGQIYRSDGLSLPKLFGEGLRPWHFLKWARPWPTSLSSGSLVFSNGAWNATVPELEVSDTTP